MTEWKPAHRASDFDPEVLLIFDQYVHGWMSRREFLDGASKFAVGGMTAAAIVLWTGIPIPEGVMRPIEMLSDAALAVMILVLGMQLEKAAWPKRPSIVVLAVSISLIVTPILSYFLCTLMGITGPALQAGVLLSSMPVAVVTIILALEFNLDPEFVTSAVFVSTLLSPLTLTPLIAYLS